MMDSKEKEKLIEKVNALIAKEEYEEAADALICSGDCREDYELSCLLAVVFNSMGDEKAERFFTAAEALLMRHYDRGKDDPNWVYIFARVLYSQGRNIQAMEFMDSIFGSKDESMAQRLKYYDEAKDYLLYTDTPSVFIDVNPGEFVIVYPEDLHAPGIGDGKIRKLVAKVLLDS